MAMSGTDGKRFSLQNTNLGSGPFGNLIAMNKILPPVLITAAVLGGAYMAVKYLRGE